MLPVKGKMASGCRVRRRRKRPGRADVTEEEGAGSRELVPGRQRGDKRLDHAVSRRLQGSGMGSVTPLDLTYKTQLQR